MDVYRYVNITHSTHIHVYINIHICMYLGYMHTMTSVHAVFLLVAHALLQTIKYINMLMCSHDYCSSCPNSIYLSIYMLFLTFLRDHVNSFSNRNMRNGREIISAEEAL